MHPANIQPCALRGDEPVCRPERAKELFSASHVLHQHRTCGRMQRHQPRSTQLGRVDGQHGLPQVDIVDPQVQRLGDAQPRDAQQAEQAVEYPRPQG
jgi:hypothetical protein